MSKSKLCQSCGGPIKDYPDKKVVNEDFCPFCVDEKGELKGYKDIVDLMIEYLEEEHKEIPNEKRLQTAQEWLSENPSWSKKYITKEVVIEDVREQNVKDIPIMNKEKQYDCNKCMFHMKNNKGDRTAKSKKEWFLKMEGKYGSCGKILYFKGLPVGFAQFAPKSEFIKLEDFEKGCTKTDAWYISCLAIQKKYQNKGLGSLLLDNVLKDLKQRGVKKLQACGVERGDASDFSSGYWKMYENRGFMKVDRDGEYIVGEIEFKE